MCPYGLRIAVPFHGFLQKRECHVLTPDCGNLRIKNFTVVINGAANVVLDAIDRHENLIAVPFPQHMLAHE